VARNNHYPDVQDSQAARAQSGDSVVPRRPGETSPIKHVIYLVKENRTYDQVFGSLGKGNGDPALNLFDDSSAPNIRSLARQFVILDNFYAAAEVSAEGWNWSTAATANTYTQKTWEANYSDNGGRNHPYEYEVGTYATASGRTLNSAYLWDCSTTPACPTATPGSGDSAPARSFRPRRTSPRIPTRPTPATTSKSAARPGWTPTPRRSTTTSGGSASTAASSVSASLTARVTSMPASPSRRASPSRSSAESSARITRTAASPRPSFPRRSGRTWSFVRRRPQRDLACRAGLASA
jgi:hypothetical protein